MSNESANMDQVFRELEAADQPDLSVMDQHWQQMKELVAVNTAPSSPGNAGSSLLKPGLWIGAGLIGVTALVAVLIHRNKTKEAPISSASTEIVKPVQSPTDTLPVTKPVEFKTQRISRRRATPVTTPATGNAEKPLPAISAPASIPSEGIIQSYPAKKKESSNSSLPVNGNTGKVKDTLRLNPVNKNRERTTPVDISSYPVKFELSGAIRFDTIKSTIPAKPANLVLYTLSPSQKKWLHTLPHSLSPFINP